MYYFYNNFMNFLKLKRFGGMNFQLRNINHLGFIKYIIMFQLNYLIHTDYLYNVFMYSLKTESLGGIDFHWRDRNKKGFIKNIFICFD